jgi:AraC family transcriptional regulator
MKTATLRDYKQRLLRVLVHIQQHLDEPLGLEGLARLACFSPFHFHRVFRGMVGESVKEHVRRLRLERAASQLKRGSDPVTQLALGAGYDTHEAFTRSFKTAFGIAPAHYRAAKRPPAEPGAGRVHYQQGRTLRDFRTAQTGGHKMNVQIKHLAPMRVAFIRHVGPYAAVSAAWDKLLPPLGKAGWLGGDIQCIGICHDDPDITPPAKLRYDACVTVDERFAPFDEIGVQVIPGGDYAMVTHAGPYAALGDTYARLLGQWLPRSGRELRATPCFEVYLNDPHSTDPEDLLADIYAPLVKLK